MIGHGKKNCTVVPQPTRRNYGVFIQLDILDQSEMADDDLTDESREKEPLHEDLTATEPWELTDQEEDKYI